MKTFKKWNKKYIPDLGAYCSDECKSFYKAFKNFLKRNFPDAEIIGFKANHYDACGFIKKGDKCIFVAHDINRLCDYCTVNFDDADPMKGVLYRTSPDEHTYSNKHGANHFTSINNMVDNINKLFAEMDKGGVV